MPTVFQTLDRNGRPHPRWRFKYHDYTGKRKTAVGMSTKSETVKLANHIQEEQDAIRKGWRPIPKVSNSPHLFSKVVADYLEWCKSQGGHGGRPCDNLHLKYNKLSKLRFWEQRLNLKMLSDLNGCLGKVEKILQELQAGGFAGKTLKHYSDALTSFCNWALEREYLEANPLKRLRPFDTTPKTRRRAMTVEEIRALLPASPHMRRVIYLVALTSGLRAKEQRSLKVKTLDINNNGLNLDAAWTKNRKSVFQPLPPAVVAELAQIAKGKQPDDFLLKVPCNLAEMLARDLQAAGIPRITAEGKLDFHALRTTFTTLTLEFGAHDKEAQSLARHETPGLTMNVYARSRSARLTEIANNIGNAIIESPTIVQQTKSEAQVIDVRPVCNGSSSDQPAQEVGGYEPLNVQQTFEINLGQGVPQPGQFSAQVGQDKDVTVSKLSNGRTDWDHSQAKAGLFICPTSVQQDDRLALICQAWPHLSASAKNEMLALLQTPICETSGVSGFSGFSR